MRHVQSVCSNLLQPERRVHLDSSADLTLVEYATLWKALEGWGRVDIHVEQMLLPYDIRTVSVYLHSPQRFIFNS